MSKHVWRTGKNISNPKALKNPDKKKCPECKQEVNVFSDGSIEQHKIYAKGSKTRYSYCPRKKM